MPTTAAPTSTALNTLTTGATVAAGGASISGLDVVAEWIGDKIGMPHDVSMAFVGLIATGIGLYLHRQTTQNPTPAGQSS